MTARITRVSVLTEASTGRLAKVKGEYWANRQNPSALLEVASLVRKGYQFREIRQVLGYAKFRRLIGTSSMYERLSNKTLGAIIGVSGQTIHRWILWLNAVPSDVLLAEKRKRIVGRVEFRKRPNGYEKVRGILHYVTRILATPELAWLAGFVAGDGTLTRRHVFVYNAYKPLVDEAARIMSTYGTVGIATRRGRFEAWLSSRAIASALADRNCYERILSEPQLATNFIAGLFDADGWISFDRRWTGSPNVNLAVTNKGLLIQIRRAMRDQLGIQSRIRLRLKAGRVSSIGGRSIQTRKDFWELHVLSGPFGNVERWAEFIGSKLHHPVKRKRAAKIRERLTRQRAPHF